MCRYSFLIVWVIAFSLCSTVVQAGKITALKVFESATPALADEVNSNFKEVELRVNENYDITDASDGRLSDAETELANLKASIAALQSTELASLKASLASLQSSVNASLPIAMIIPYAGSVDTIPDGWLLCDGAELNRVTYQALFDVLGISHGGGDGVLTFNIPDFRGRFLRGVDHGAGRDPNRTVRTAPKPNNVTGFGNSGDKVGSVQADATARPNSNFTTSASGNHRHPIQTRQDDYNVSGGTTPSYGGDNGTFRVSNYTDYAGSHSHSISGGGDAETRPTNVNVNWLIKY